jgi:hypothetical protein
VVGVGRIDSARAECQPGTTLFRLDEDGNGLQGRLPVPKFAAAKASDGEVDGLPLALHTVTP